jgi:hypothetical protein
MHLTPVAPTGCASRFPRPTGDQFGWYGIEDHCLLDEAIEQFTPGPRSSAVESEGKLIQVVIQMRGSHRSLMRPQQPSFQQRRNSVRQRQQIVSDGGLLSDNFVGVSASFQAVVAAPSVGAHPAPRRDHAGDSCFQSVAGGVRYLPQADTTDPLAILLSRHEDQHLPFRSPASFSGPGTADKGLIDFHHSRQAIPTRTYHGAPQLVQPSPGCAVTAQSQQALQPQGVHPLLLIRHVPHRLKPKPQGFPGILEECPGSERSFKVTLRAAEKHASHSPRPAIPAARATKPFGPTKTQHILSAAVLSGKRILKLLHRFRILLHTAGHYIWYQRESSAYPDY